MKEIHVRKRVRSFGVNGVCVCILVVQSKREERLRHSDEFVQIFS